MTSKFKIHFYWLHVQLVISSLLCSDKLFSCTLEPIRPQSAEYIKFLLDATVSNKLYKTYTYLRRTLLSVPKDVSSVNIAVLPHLLPPHFNIREVCLEEP